jgi:hypothetical protein
LWATFVYGTGASAQTTDAGSAATGSTSGIGSSYYFLRSCCGLAGWQFNINNSYVPNFRPNKDLTYTLLMNSYGVSQDTLGGCNKNINTLTNWETRYWVASVSLDHPCASDERYISGLNTIGNTAQGFFEYFGTTFNATFGPTTVSTCTGLVFAQTTSVLQIGAGRQLNIVL